MYYLRSSYLLPPKTCLPPHSAKDNLTLQTPGVYKIHWEWAQWTGHTITTTEKSAVAEYSFNLCHCIHLQNMNILAKINVTWTTPLWKPPKLSSISHVWKKREWDFDWVSHETSCLYSEAAEGTLVKDEEALSSYLICLSRQAFLVHLFHTNIILPEP